MSGYILAIDEGTTGVTSMVFDHEGKPRSKANREFTQFYPRPGWVEHDPEEIWQTTLLSAEGAFREAEVDPQEILGIGITNQRETSVFWKKGTFEPYGKAIVWQCRRSAPTCSRLRAAGHEDLFRRKTGLVIDPYFSGTKVTWMMENDPEFAREARAGRISFGTVDSWLIYRLTGGSVHATDYSNASRTLMFNIKDLVWDEELLSILDVPPGLLPEVLPSSGVFGETDPDVFFGVKVPVCGVAGDQQAALFGQACYHPGMTKNTYGTGSFVLMNTGSVPVESAARLVTTIAWGLGGKVEYALEGSIFVTGAAIQWLRDGLGLISHVAETGPLAEKVPDSGGVYFVPALVGLGAPYWDPYARGAIVGITRGTTREHLVRATMEAMAYQTRDVMEAMEKDSGLKESELRVDGGAAVMDVLLQFQADLLGISVVRPVVQETTALGAAYLAGLAVGYWDDLNQLEKTWRAEKTFEPGADMVEMEKKYRWWKKAVEKAKGWEEE